MTSPTRRTPSSWSARPWSCSSRTDSRTARRDSGAPVRAVRPDSQRSRKGGRAGLGSPPVPTDTLAESTGQLSFVVPAWNEERWLPGTLAAIFAAAPAARRPFEVVVADDGSTDGTAAIGRAAGAFVVSVAHRQIAATRNSGARAA